jgi:hypothetical protein
MDLLESFMGWHEPQTAPQDSKRRKKGNGSESYQRQAKTVKTGWPRNSAGNPGELKIIDLTDPVIDSDSACVLFDIFLAIFLEKTSGGKLIALDEAHNVSTYIVLRERAQDSSDEAKDQR